jgi:hypothetical protein
VFSSLEYRNISLMHWGQPYKKIILSPRIVDWVPLKFSCIQFELGDRFETKKIVDNGRTDKVTIYRYLVLRIRIRGLFHLWIWDPEFFFMIRDLGYRISDPGSRIPDLGSRISDPGSRVSDPGSRIPDLGSRISDPSWISDPSRISDLGSRISDHKSKFLRV